MTSRFSLRHEESAVSAAQSLIELKDMEPERIRALLARAERFLDDRGRPTTPVEERDRLHGKAIALLFFEPSTRTRVSFELAAKALGAHVVRLGEEESSLTKGESLLDTCLNLEAMGIAGFVVRHASISTPHQLAERLDVPVINAGNGSGEHPTQALLDALTLTRAMRGQGGLEGKTVAIVGDVIRSRVARSNVYALTTLGARVVIAGPSLMMPEHDQEGPWRLAEFASSRAEALRQADAVILLRIQRERMRHDTIDVDDYARRWGVDTQVMREECRPEAWLLHPGPVMHGVELSEEAASGPRSLILDQGRCGVALRQAVLCDLIERGSL